MIAMYGKGNFDLLLPSNEREKLFQLFDVDVDNTFNNLKQQIDITNKSYCSSLTDYQTIMSALRQAHVTPYTVNEKVFNLLRDSLVIAIESHGMTYCSTNGINKPESLTKLYTFIKALIYQNQSNNGDDQALRYVVNLLERCYQQREMILGKEHIDTLSTLQTLAQCYWDIDSFTTALELFQDCYVRFLTSFGEYHIDTLTVLKSYALCQRGEGKTPIAESLLNMCYTKVVSILNDESTISSMSVTDVKKLLSIARSLAKSYEWDSDDNESSNTNSGTLSSKAKATVLYEMGYEMSKRVLGDNHHDSLEAMKDLAMFYVNENDVGKGEHMLEDWLNSTKAAHDNEESVHPDIATATFKLAEFYSQQENYDQARLYYEQAYEQYQAAFGESHSKTLVMMFMIGEFYLSHHNYTMAKYFYETCYEREQALGGISGNDYNYVLFKLPGSIQFVNNKLQQDNK